MNTSTPKRSEKDIREFQEKKNLQDQLYMMNQDIQKTRDDLQKLSLCVEKNKASLETAHKYLQIEMQNVVEEFELLSTETNETNLQCLNRIKQCSQFLQEKISGIPEIYVSKYELEVLITSLVKNQHAIAQSMEELKNYVNTVYSSLKGDLSHQTARLREDLKQDDTKVIEVENALKSQIRLLQAEIEGLRTDNAYHKRNHMQMQRKIEDMGRTQ